jgi:hypothetical protein
MNLRGKFTDRCRREDQLPQHQARRLSDSGRRSGRRTAPRAGPHNMRPAHIHFLIFKPGFKTQFSQVYSSDDPFLDTDVQFAVTRRLVAHYVRHEPKGRRSAPGGLM